MEIKIIKKSRFRCLLLLLLPLAINACAGNPSQPALEATSRDLDEDRILVTLRTEIPVGIAALSPSGRLDYQPPSAQEIRSRQIRAAQQIASAFDAQVQEDWEIPSLEVHCFVFRLNDPDKRHIVVAQLQEHPDVESVQSLQFFHGETSNETSDKTPTGGDPLANWDSGLNERLLAVHRNTTGKSVTIAVIDAGVDTAHEDLDGAALRTVDLVDGRENVPAEAHGTAVVGLLSARHENGIGIRGYAPDAGILLIRACWEAEPGSEPAVCNSFTLAKALSLALESGADIVNLSISGPRDPLLERLAGELVQRGQLVIAAGRDTNTFPGSVLQSVLATRYAPANGGPPEPAFTLLPGNRYGLRNGTSIATARVAGAAALMKELLPHVSAAEFEALLMPDRTPASPALLNVTRLLNSSLIQKKNDTSTDRQIHQ